MLDGVLREACEKVGGALELARRLGVSKQAIYGFADTGIPEMRVHEISEMTGIPRAELIAYAEQKRRAKRPAPPLRVIEPRPEIPPNPEFVLGRWHLYGSYPGKYPRPAYPPPPPPFRPATPAGFATFRLFAMLDAVDYWLHIRNALGFKVPHRAILMSCARYLHDGKPYSLRPEGTIPPDCLRKIGGNGWYDTRTIASFRLIAKFFNAREVAMDGCTVFFPRGHDGVVG